MERFWLAQRVTNTPSRMPISYSYLSALAVLALHLAGPVALAQQAWGPASQLPAGLRWRDAAFVEGTWVGLASGEDGGSYLVRGDSARRVSAAAAYKLIAFESELLLRFDSHTDGAPPLRSLRADSLVNRADMRLRAYASDPEQLESLPYIVDGRAATDGDPGLAVGERKASGAVAKSLAPYVRRAGREVVDRTAWREEYATGTNSSFSNVPVVGSARANGRLLTVNWRPDNDVALAGGRTSRRYHLRVARLDDVTASELTADTELSAMPVAVAAFGAGFALVSEREVVSIDPGSRQLERSVWSVTPGHRIVAAATGAAGNLWVLTERQDGERSLREIAIDGTVTRAFDATDGVSLDGIVGEEVGPVALLLSNEEGLIIESTLFPEQSDYLTQVDAGRVLAKAAYPLTDTLAHAPWMYRGQNTAHFGDDFSAALTAEGDAIVIGEGDVRVLRGLSGQYLGHATASALAERYVPQANGGRFFVAPEPQAGEPKTGDVLYSHGGTELAIGAETLDPLLRTTVESVTATPAGDVLVTYLRYPNRGCCVTNYSVLFDTLGRTLATLQHDAAVRPAVYEQGVILAGGATVQFAGSTYGRSFLSFVAWEYLRRPDGLPSEWRACRDAATLAVSHHSDGPVRDVDPTSLKDAYRVGPLAYPIRITQDESLLEAAGNITLDTACQGGPGGRVLIEPADAARIDHVLINGEEGRERTLAYYPRGRAIRINIVDTSGCSYPLELKQPYLAIEPLALPACFGEPTGAVFAGGSNNQGRVLLDLMLDDGSTYPGGLSELPAGQYPITIASRAQTCTWDTVLVVTDVATPAVSFETSPAPNAEGVLLTAVSLDEREYRFDWDSQESGAVARGYTPGDTARVRVAPANYPGCAVDLSTVVANVSNLLNPGPEVPSLTGHVDGRGYLVLRGAHLERVAAVQVADVSGRQHVAKFEVHGVGTLLVAKAQPATSPGLHAVLLVDDAGRPIGRWWGRW